MKRQQTAKEEEIMQKEQGGDRLGRVHVLWGVLVVLAVLLVMTMAAAALCAVLPMSVTEKTEPPQAGPGDTVTVTITVSNPNPQTQIARTNDSTWYNHHLIVEIDPALQIDDVVVIPPPDDLDVEDNTITVLVHEVAPGESFTTTVYCTVLGDVEPGHLIFNRYRLEYTDAEGSPQTPILVYSLSRVMLPIVGKNY
jgi:hypothetical protein